jgi:hypothetical protein
MRVKAMQGYFENGVFYQQGRRVALPERRMVIVNVLDVPVDIDEAGKAVIGDLTLASERSLAKDWLLPEEDAAWGSL